VPGTSATRGSSLSKRRSLPGKKMKKIESKIAGAERRLRIRELLCRTTQVATWTEPLE
jgi:hypothetical protein